MPRLWFFGTFPLLKLTAKAVYLTAPRFWQPAKIKAGIRIGCMPLFLLVSAGKTSPTAGRYLPLLIFHLIR